MKNSRILAVIFTSLIIIVAVVLTFIKTNTHKVDYAPIGEETSTQVATLEISSTPTKPETSSQTSAVVINQNSQTTTIENSSKSTSEHSSQTNTNQSTKPQTSSSNQNSNSTTITDSSEVSIEVEESSPVIEESSSVIEESSIPPTPTYTYLADRDDLLTYASLYGHLASNGQPTTIHTEVEDVAVGNWPTLSGDKLDSSFKFWVGGGSTASPNVEEVVYNVEEFAYFTVEYAYGAYSGSRCVSGANMTAKIYVDGNLWDEVQIDDTQHTYAYTGRMFLNGASQLRIEVSTVYPTYGECIIRVQMCDTDTIF